MLISVRADHERMVISELNIGDGFAGGGRIGFAVDQGAHLVFRDPHEHAAWKFFQIALKICLSVRIFDLFPRGGIFFCLQGK